MVNLTYGNGIGSYLIYTEVALKKRMAKEDIIWNDKQDMISLN